MTAKEKGMRSWKAVSARLVIIHAPATLCLEEGNETFMKMAFLATHHVC